MALSVRHAAIFVAIIGCMALAYRAPALKRARVIPRICALLRRAYPDVRAEFEALPRAMITTRHRSPHEWGGGPNIHDLMELHRYSTGWMYAWKNATEPNHDWQNFGLVFDGRPIGRNCELCPRTMELLANIPGLEIAGFSLLRAHGRIDAHTDKLHPRNRTFHLGIYGQGHSILHIQQGGSVRTLRQSEGEALAFDSRQMHWVHNAHDDIRVVLYLDVRI